MALASCFATAVEERRPLPGDGMVPNPIFTSTHTVTIDAPPEEVWPWIAQMGGGRAGCYSWDSIDNGDTPSSTSLVPALQCVVPGDVIPAVPGATDAFVVAAVEPPRGLGSRDRVWSHGGLTFLEAPRLDGSADTVDRAVGAHQHQRVPALGVMLGAVLWRTGTPQGEAS